MLMEIPHLELLMKAKAKELHQAQAPDDFLRVARQICGLTQDVNLSLARVLRIRPDDIKQADALLHFSLDTIATRHNLSLPDNVCKQLADLEGNIRGRIDDLGALGKKAVSLSPLLSVV